MKKLILHIGRHKTGTSSIQQVLFSSREILKKIGILYPITGIRGFGHHIFSERYRRANAYDNDSALYNQDVYKELIQEISLSSCQTIIISSEFFQNCCPHRIKKLFKGFDVTVVCYFRNKLDYTTSAWVQKIQATDYSQSLRDFAREFNLSYSGFFEQWTSAFHDFQYRSYEKKALLNNNSAEDFISSYIPSAIGKVSVSANRNPSIGLELALIKRAMNILHPHENLSKSLYEKMSIMAADKRLNHTKVMLTKNTLDKCLKFYEDDDDKFFSLSRLDLSSYRYRFHTKKIQAKDFDPFIELFSNYEFDFDYNEIKKLAIKLFNEEYTPLENTNSSGNLVLGVSSYKNIKDDDRFFESEEFEIGEPDYFGQPFSMEHLKSTKIEVKNYIRTVYDGFLIGKNSIVLDERSKIIESTLWMSGVRESEFIHSSKETGWNYLIDSDIFISADNMNATIAVVGNEVINTSYFHWHFETLSRVWLLKKNKLIDEIDFLYSGEIPIDGFHYKSLLMLGIPKEKIITSNLDNVYVSKMLIPVVSSSVSIPLLQRLKSNGGVHFKGWSKNFVKIFTQSMRSNVKIKPSVASKKLFVDRIDRKTRQIVNTDDFQAFIDKHGFHVVDPGRLSFNEQVSLFSDASLVIGIHSADLTNCLYMPDNATLIELIPEVHPDVGFRMLAQIKGLSYKAFYCPQPQQKHVKPKNDHIFIDISRLELLMRVD